MYPIRQNAGINVHRPGSQPEARKTTSETKSSLCVYVVPNVPGMDLQRSQQGHNFHFRPDMQTEHFGKSSES